MSGGAPAAGAACCALATAAAINIAIPATIKLARIFIVVPLSPQNSEKSIPLSRSSNKHHPRPELAAELVGKTNAV
jgi:hypothetical protein